MRPSLLPLLCGLLLPAALAAQADQPGSADHRLFPRITGYYIYSHRDADPVIEQFRNGHDADRDTIEGRVTRIGYGLPRGTQQQPTPPLGLIRHYERIVQQLGGTITYRQPSYGELTARLVQDGREFWLYLHAESVTEYGVVVAERSAPVRAGAVALGSGSSAAGSCPCAGQAAPSRAGLTMLPASARQFALAEARFALDTTWVPVVRPSRGTHHAVVSIRGAHVEDATEVRFGETTTPILYRSASELVVAVPERPVGLVPVVVSGPAGARAARDSFQVYQEPMSDGSRDLRVYTCTDPPRSGAPNVTSLAPQTATIGDTLVINGTMLDEVDWVQFTYRIRRDAFSALRDRDRNWTGEGFFTTHLMPENTERAQIAALPVTQTATRLTVVVPRRARTGPIALFGYGACVVSDEALAVRQAPPLR